MYASNYYENKIMSLLLGGSQVTAPTDLYVGLFQSNPTDTGAGGTEIAYTGYTRMPITFEGPTVLTSGASMQNTAAIVFPESPSASNTVRFIGIFDGNNNMWLYGELSTPLNVQAGVSPVFQPGSLKWTFSGNLSSVYRERVMNLLITRQGVNTFNPYIALYSGDPNNGGRELSGVDYARIPVTFAASATQPQSGALVYENTAEVVSSTAGIGGWSGNGPLTHIAIMDAAQAGNIFVSMAIRNNASYTISYGDVVGFHAGDISFSIN